MKTTLQWAMLFSALTESIDRPEETHPADHRAALIDITDRVIAELEASHVGLAFIMPTLPEVTP